MLKPLILGFFLSLALSGLSLFNQINVLCDAGSFEVHENTCKNGEVLYITRGFPLAFEMKLTLMNVLVFMSNAFVFFAIILIVLILTKRIRLLK